MSESRDPTAAAAATKAEAAATAQTDTETDAMPTTCEAATDALTAENVQVVDETEEPTRPRRRRRERLRTLAATANDAARQASETAQHTRAWVRRMGVRARSTRAGHTVLAFLSYVYAVMLALARFLRMHRFKLLVIVSVMQRRMKPVDFWTACGVLWVLWKGACLMWAAARSCMKPKQIACLALSIYVLGVWLGLTGDDTLTLTRRLVIVWYNMPTVLVTAGWIGSHHLKQWFAELVDASVKREIERMARAHRDTTPVFTSRQGD